MGCNGRIMEAKPLRAAGIRIKEYYLQCSSALREKRNYIIQNERTDLDWEGKSDTIYEGRPVVAPNLQIRQLIPTSMYRRIRT